MVSLGADKSEIDTPALLIDLDMMEGYLDTPKRYADMVLPKGLRL